MPKQLDYDFEAVIIGAGISGLVCGCYLAKAGIKTLIIEKNPQAGGCCVSFIRNGFKFDACGHFLGGVGKNGPIGIILKELDIENKIKINRYDPSEIIAMPDRKFYFWNDLNKTIKGLQVEFPEEKKKIKDFFNFINKSTGKELIQFWNSSFSSFLKQYFNDKKLKTILSIPVLVNSGTSAYSISTFSVIKLYKQYILDGGYYTAGGIGKFPNLLANTFQEFGGQLWLSTFATKIKVKKNTAAGVFIKNKFIKAKYIISNIGSKETFLNLLGKNLLNKKLLKKINTLKATASMYILYLGLNKCFSDGLKVGITYWMIDDYNINGISNNIQEQSPYNIAWYGIRLLPDKKTIICFTNAFFKSEKYWATHRKIWMKALIKKITQRVPELSKYITFKEDATPQTLYKYTLNYQGARCGWKSIPSQLALSGFSQKTFLGNLYLTGHWTTIAAGIPGVAYLGRNTANIILRKEENNVKR